MAGYSGYSMSNNAVDAYSDGEKPLSKWTKKDLINAVFDYIKSNPDEKISFNMENLKKVPLSVLKSALLYKSSWHHTSEFFNQTDFYSLDENTISDMTDKKIADLIQQSSEKVEEQQPETWKCKYLEWSGSRNHPRATEHIAVGQIKGNWFFLDDGSKKKITANGFEKISREDKSKVSQIKALGSCSEKKDSICPRKESREL